MNFDHTSQKRLDGIHVDASELPPSAVLQSTLTSDVLQDTLTDAVRDMLAGTKKSERTLTLREQGLTARDGRYAPLVGCLDVREEDALPHQIPPEPVAHKNTLRYTVALGRGESAPVWSDYPTLKEALESDLVDDPLAVLAAAGVTPTIAARIDKDDFAERPRRQRENTLQLLATFATQCDVHLVCTWLRARWLADNLRSDPPLNFDSCLDTGRDGPHPAEEVASDALRTLNPECGSVQVLRELVDEPTQTVPQSSLPDLVRRDASTVSQHLNKHEGLDLVDRYSVGAGDHVLLCEAGSVLLDRLDAENGRQAKANCLFDTTRHSNKRPSKPPSQRGEGGPPRQQPLTAAADNTTTVARLASRSNHRAAVVFRLADSMRRRMIGASRQLCLAGCC
ncbi:hypothetical protein SAMN05216388_10686 [Halorientalis persicus]|uniref:Uncharacterized protein n=1 Tax=Halorientalis persicus TaxID=1367881 RepID=A0A1H8WP61_9EURY|nr:hypothetical protein SAMN05216388_10686 [Halorientalis persicus]